jgi:hypothetical protein
MQLDCKRSGGRRARREPSWRLRCRQEGMAMTEDQKYDRGREQEIATRNDPAAPGEPENVGASGNPALAGDLRTPRAAYDPGEYLDAGAFIGHEPERAAETIPGGVQPADERVSAYDSQPSGEGALDKRLQEGEVHGHRYGLRADDDQAREAGENR